MPNPQTLRYSLLAVLLALTTSMIAAAAEGPDSPPPTHADLKYGEHERQVLDFWRAETAGPAPVLVWIHGGGWMHGSKEKEMKLVARELPQLLAHGISVALINYRYSTMEPLPAPVHDAARAIQYLRYRAADLGIDPARIAASGGSAGGCTSLWLATHDDLADPDAEDPIARESSRICGAYAHAAQTTLVPADIREHVAENALGHPMIARAGGYKTVAELEADWENAEALYREFSPVTHISKDDPPICLAYYGKLDSQTDGIHHVKFGVYFKEQADAAGATCYLGIHRDTDLYPGAPTKEQFIHHVLLGKPLPAKK